MTSGASLPTRLFAALRSLLYAAVFFTLWGWLAVQARGLDGRLGGALPNWTPLLGILILAAGAALALACVLSFAFRGRGTPAPFDAPRELVVAGPYRWVRNPMYLGGLLVLWGYGLLVRSPAVLLLGLAFLGVFHLFVLFYEEPHLGRTFGASYEAYRERVSRWWPRPPGRAGD